MQVHWSSFNTDVGAGGGDRTKTKIMFHWSSLNADVGGGIYIFFLHFAFLMSDWPNQPRKAMSVNITTKAL